MKLEIKNTKNSTTLEVRLTPEEEKEIQEELKLVSGAIVESESNP